MEIVDWLGFTGVAILLLAYLLNIVKRLTQDSPGYSLLNFVGALLACLASVLLEYWPFIILEGIWAMVSLFKLVQLLRKKGFE